MTHNHSPKQFLTKTRPGVFILACVLLLLTIAGFFLADPMARFLFSSGYTCPLYSFSGLHCPACGTTRAVYALFQGEFLRALSLNPLFFLSAAVFLGFLTYLFFCALRPRFRPLSLRLTSRQLWVILGVVLGYGVLRNLFGF